MMVQRVVATEAALEVIRVLQNKFGPLMFHQSGGCCDNSAPECYPRGEFLIGQVDVLLGEIGDSPFYIGRSHYEFSKHTQLIIDVVEGNGGTFSLEGTVGKAFLTRPRLFSDEEWAALVESGVVEA